jgi:AcrR family transcriptional regulator
VPRQKLRTPELRVHLLHSALGTLESHGPGGFTTRRVADEASTSVPAVYELFGDKAGLVRELFFEGFRLLRDDFERLPTTDDPIEDLRAAVQAMREFASRHPGLTEVMFMRPFADFDPSPEDLAAGAATRRFLVDCVRRGVDAGVLAGDPVDIAHGLLALAQGLAVQEAGGWLGSSKTSVDRRWRTSVAAMVDGYRPRA